FDLSRDRSALAVQKDLHHHPISRSEIAHERIRQAHAPRISAIVTDRESNAQAHVFAAGPAVLVDAHRAQSDRGLGASRCDHRRAEDRLPGMISAEPELQLRAAGQLQYRRLAALESDRKLGIRRDLRERGWG